MLDNAIIEKNKNHVATPTTVKKESKLEAIVIEPLNGKFVTIDYNEEFNAKGVRLVAIHFNMPIELINFCSAYQRALEDGRLKTLIKSYAENGVWQSLTATINTSKNPVDGNHRITCLIAIGHKTIPIVHEFEFTTAEAEVDFFLEINKMGTQIKAPQYVWRAKYLAKHVAGLLFYKLTDEDELSFLFDKVSIAERPSTLKRIPINSAWQLIAKCGLGYSKGWRNDEEEIYNAKIKEIGYEIVLNRINEFLIFFNNCFGPKERGSICWKAKTFKAFIHLFILLKKNNLLNTTSKYKRTVQRISKFNIDENLAKMEFGSLMTCLIDKYNIKKKEHNRILITNPFIRE